MFKKSEKTCSKYKQLIIILHLVIKVFVNSIFLLLCKWCGLLKLVTCCDIYKIKEYFTILADQY